MEFHGINKLSLLDYPGHLACTLFTGHCNFRCPFCHNASLVLHPETEPLLDTDDILNFLKKRVGVLEGICITGGEPTLQPDLLAFMEACKSLGYLIKLDTNGTRPDVLEKLLAAGLPDSFAMDIKNSKENYAKTAGVPSLKLSAVEDSISLIRNSGKAYEFRTTVVRELHTPEDIQKIGEWLSGAPFYALQAYTDSGDILADGMSAYTAEEMNRLREIAAPYFGTVVVRGV